MCGIAGLWDAEPAELAPVVERMLAVIAHRGPDGDGTFVEGAFALGHRRLSIIDLDDRALAADAGRPAAATCSPSTARSTTTSSCARSSRSSASRFRTESDTEVLLAAYATWGSDCLQRFNGMFAFAIFDRVERALFCARDRLGVKPLVYVHDGRRFAFASEHKALVAAGATSGELAPDAVYEYIARGYTSGGRSFFAGVESLLPGHALELAADGTLRTWAWWQPDTTPDEDRSFDDWSGAIAELLEDAVRLRLRSDVPVGAHLSGGLDSSAIVAAARRGSARSSRRSPARSRRSPGATSGRTRGASPTATGSRGARSRSGSTSSPTAGTGCSGTSTSRSPAPAPSPSCSSATSRASTG